MPESRPPASVSSTASTRHAAIRRHASETVVPSGIVSALDSRSFLTVRSPLTKPGPPSTLVTAEGRGRNPRKYKASADLRGVVGGCGLGGDFAVAVAVGDGGGGRGIIGLGPAGGRGRRRPAASAAIKGHSRGGGHDRGGLGGGGFSTGGREAKRRRPPGMLEGNDRWLLWASLPVGPAFTFWSLVCCETANGFPSRLCSRGEH